MNTEDTSVLIIYTGGTIGMISDPDTGAYMPFNLQNILSEVPEIGRFGFNLHSVELKEPIDSSMIDPQIWKEIALLVRDNYEKYDGFVILHGTDTMAYSASALSFMFENLSKPVILTGSQLPINTLRTDGRENLISSIEIAAAKKDGKALVPEVCIYFEFKLYRGNRTAKRSAEHFNAFESSNYPNLADAGISINYNFNHIMKNDHVGEKLMVNFDFDNSVVIFRLFPGMNEVTLKSILSIPGLRGVVLESYGSGNAPEHGWFIKQIADAVQKGIIILNISQCSSGSVVMERYRTGRGLLDAGVIGGSDMTTEAAVTKLMYLLGRYSDHDLIVQRLKENISGELTHPVLK